MIQNEKQKSKKIKQEEKSNNDEKQSLTQKSPNSKFIVIGRFKVYTLENQDNA